jgi:hypothetical protein
VEVRLARQPLPVSDRLLVLGPAEDEVEQQVRTAAFRNLVGPFVWGLSDMTQKESPLVPWLLGGLAAAMIVTIGSMVVVAIDLQLRVGRALAALSRIGLTRRRALQIESLQVAVAYTALMVPALIVGSFLCLMVTRVAGNVSLPWSALGFVWASFGCGLVLFTTVTAGARPQSVG